MSWNQSFSEYPENVDKNYVQAEWDAAARCAGRGEGSAGLGGKIQWLEAPICDSKDEAEDFILKRDNWNHGQMAVRYREPGEPTKEVLAIQSALRDARAKYRVTDEKIHYQNAKAELIGCKSCGSRLARAYLRSNYCPLCRADLRPESTKQALKRQADKIKALEAKLDAALKKAAQKSGKVSWLVKTEYHT